jgi:hypothetical protein
MGCGDYLVSLRKYTGQDGFYAAYEVHPLYHNWFKDIQGGLELDNPVHDFHCTLMYSKHYTSSAPFEIQDHAITSLGRIEVFKMQEGAAVVIHCNCEELQDIHKSLVAAGLKHSYDSYNPHVTLGYVSELTEDLSTRIMNYNSWVDNTDSVAAFLLHEPYYMDIVE